MLEVLGIGTFPVGMFFGNFGRKRKRGLVELIGISSTCDVKAPEINNIFVHKINRITISFRYYGTIDNKSCIFKLDTSSDMSVFNAKIVNFSKQLIPINNCKLKYYTGEEVDVRSKVIVRIILIGKYVLDFSLK